jgi:hypothetical protein
MTDSIVLAIQLPTRGEGAGHASTATQHAVGRLQSVRRLRQVILGQHRRGALARYFTELEALLSDELVRSRGR